MPKRREPTSATMVQQYQEAQQQKEQEEQRTFKRVNSKEELTDTESEQRPPVRRLSTTEDLETSLKEARTQERAMKALSKAHCAESLACLLELFKWENETDDAKKKEIEDRIVNEFMTKDVPNEIFLPDTIRDRIQTGKSSLSEVKTHVLRDLRFNSTLLKAIGSA